MTTRPLLGEQLNRAKASPELIASLNAQRERPAPTPTPEVAAMLIELEAPEPSPATNLPPAPIEQVKRTLRSGHRKNSVLHSRFGGAEWRLLDRNQRAKLWTIAQDMERATKKKGARNGCLGAVGLKVLNALLFRFLNVNSGRCDPSYDTLQKVTGLCRQSITNALDRLEASGLITVTRRMMRFIEHGITIVRQISNAYVLTDPSAVTIPATASERTWRPFPPRRTRGGIGDILARLFERQSLSLANSRKPKHPLASRSQILPT